MEKIDTGLVCDGCGQVASQEHIAKRLRRLEWATRHRPVHIRAVLLGAAAPESDEEFFYTRDGALSGEAQLLAEAAGLTPSDPKEQLHAAFQRAGFFAIHVLECPFEDRGAKGIMDLLTERLPFAMARIRRSLRPIRVALTSPWLDPFLEQLQTQLAGFEIVTNAGKAFRLDSAAGSWEAILLRRRLAAESA